MTKISKPIVFFGNEKLATGNFEVDTLIRDAVKAAGFEIEQHLTGPLSELKPHKAQIAVLAAYGRIIPQSVLDQFPKGIVNVHPSLLPHYRGPTPIEQAILDGVSKTGVSIMRLSAGMDEGPLYKQRTMHLSANESKFGLTKALQKLGSELIYEVLPLIESGSLVPRNQPHPNRATYSHKLAKTDGRLDLSKPAEQLEREVRAFYGWPSSFTTLAGKEVVVLASHVASKVEPKELALKTGKDYLVLDLLKPANGKEMSAQAFLAGHKHLLS